MELNSALVALALFALIMAFGALALSVWNTIEIQAQKRSTHSVIPITPDTTMQRIEKQLEDITKGAGMQQGDLNRNLYEAGLDVENLV